MFVFKSTFMRDAFSLTILQSNVTQYVDKAQGECLNQSVDHKWDNIFKKDESYLESDTDEQLLIYVPFTQPIKIHSLCFQAPDDGSVKPYHGALSLRLTNDTCF